jgi:3-hydroxy acid dehydrogenase/malonic semialdehyde reductase
MPTSVSISGRTALITGASSGIGAAIAEELASLGVRLILWARRKERLDELAAKLAAAHPSLPPITTACVDVTNAGEVEAALASILEPIDILINNAGLALGKDPVQALDMADVQTMIDTNILALVRLTRLVVPGMVGRDAGHVLNLSSVAGHYAYGGGAIYSGSKHFVAAFTHSLREDLVETNVRVTAISPGAVRTEFSLVRFKGDAAAADAVYAGFEELQAADCADAAVWALTRPPHVQVGDVVLWATRQATPQVYGRRTIGGGRVCV